MTGRDAAPSPSIGPVAVEGLPVPGGNAGHAEPDPLETGRWELLHHLNALLELPMLGLSFGWLALTIVDLTTGLGRTLEAVSYAIWALFVLHFSLGLVIAPTRTAYIRQNWLTVVALLLPAVRILRVFRAFRLLRAARTVRSLSLVRLIASLNRGMRAVAGAIGRRGVGYVAALTVLVTVAGAAGMARFESPAALNEAGLGDVARAGGGLDGYGEALWWTAMIMTTMGSEYWPKTAEGRILGWLLALYAFAVFGYLTATIATIFLGQDNAGRGSSGEVRALHAEIAALRAQVAALGEAVAASAPAGASHGGARAVPGGSRHDARTG